MKSGITLIKDFFGNVKLAEMKALTKEEREELAQEIAKQQGLVAFPAQNGSFQYGNAA